MNVIFLDFDGVLDTMHYTSDEDIEEKIKILADICKKYDCKIVIEAAAKDAIDEETMAVDSEWVKLIFDLFKKYNIKCIGRTPNVVKRKSNNSYISMWKEDEIRLYLYRHLEIQHYCVIDDDDLQPCNSDLDKVRDHLVKTNYFCERKEEEGLLKEHEQEVGKMLQKENEIRRLVLKKNSKKNK